MYWKSNKGNHYLFAMQDYLGLTQYPWEIKRPRRLQRSLFRSFLWWYCPLSCIQIKDAILKVCYCNRFLMPLELARHTPQRTILKETYSWAFQWLAIADSVYLCRLWSGLGAAHMYLSLIEHSTLVYRYWTICADVWKTTAHCKHRLGVAYDPSSYTSS